MFSQRTFTEYPVVTGFHPRCPSRSCAVPAPVGFCPALGPVPTLPSHLCTLHMLFQHPEVPSSGLYPRPPRMVEMITVTPYLPLNSSWEFVAWSDMETTGPWMARVKGWCGARWPFREGNQLISSAGGWRRKRLKEQGVFLEKLLAPQEPGVLPSRRWGWGGGRAGGSWSCLLSSAWPRSRSASADLT